MSEERRRESRQPVVYCTTAIVKKTFSRSSLIETQSLSIPKLDPSTTSTSSDHTGAPSPSIPVFRPSQTHFPHNKTIAPQTPTAAPANIILSPLPSLLAQLLLGDGAGGVVIAVTFAPVDTALIVLVVKVTEPTAVPFDAPVAFKPGAAVTVGFNDDSAAANVDIGPEIWLTASLPWASRS